MRRSASVPIASLGAAALAFTAAGCGDDEQTAYCTDANQQVVENERCDQQQRTGGGFFWFFAGGGSRFRPGQRVGGAGSLVDAGDKAALRRYGGFGSSARGGGTGRSFGGGGGGFFSGGG